MTNRPGKNVRCPGCRAAAVWFDGWSEEFQKRPVFRCSCCGDRWSCGHGGGPYAATMPPADKGRLARFEKGNR